jgi:hypothetical protein
MTRHTTRFGGRAAAVAAVATAVLALGGLSAATAQAAPQSARTRAAATAAPATQAALTTTTTGFFTAGGVTIRFGPGTASTLLGQGRQGQAVHLSCQAPGDWYPIPDRATGATGWSYGPDSIPIDSLSPNPPGC